MAPTRVAPLAVLAAVALSASACGSAASSHHTTSSHHATASHRVTPARRHASRKSSPPAPPGRGSPIPAPGPTGIAANASAVAVIKAWSTALRRGDIRTAASYFKLPSELVNGIGATGDLELIRIRSLAQAEVANQSLPCGAKFISADQRGRYVNALFKLTGRTGPGAGCGSGAGQTARTNFLIAGGRIVQWIRAPNDPGDNGGSNPAQGQGGGAPVV
jgi:hypothetical protein